MPISAKTKNLLGSLFAISTIMQRCALPGIVGIVLFSVGLWQHITWLRIAGVVLAAPMIWVYFVIIFVFLPWGLFDTIRRRLRS